MPSYRKDTKTAQIPFKISKDDRELLKDYGKQKGLNKTLLIETYIENLRLPKQPLIAKERLRVSQDNIVKDGIYTTPERKEKIEKYAELWGVTVQDVIDRCISSAKDRAKWGF